MGHIVGIGLAIALLLFGSSLEVVRTVFGDKAANEANSFLAVFDVLHDGKINGGKDASSGANDKGNENSSTVIPSAISQIPLYPLAKVIKVTDGDTVTVQTRQTDSGRMDGTYQTKEIKLRLIGINTPETVDPRRPVQCFGKAASEKAGELLDAATVRLEQDSSQGELDRYGRTLAYIHIQDPAGRGPEVFFNRYMILEGYAYEYTYDKPYLYQGDFKAAQAEAKNQGKGLWKEGVCSSL